MSKQAFIALATTAGIEVEYTSGRRRHPRTGEPVSWEITLDAPHGKVFRGSGCHVDCSLQGEYGQVTPVWIAEAKRLKQIIEDGFDDCDVTECETCTNDLEDPV